MTLEEKVAQCAPKTSAEYVCALAGCIDFGNGQPWSLDSQEAYNAVLALSDRFDRLEGSGDVAGTLRASAGYNSWRGACAFDDADFSSIRSLLRETGRLREGEFLYGLDVWSGDNVSLGDKELAPADVKAFIVPGRNVAEAQAFIEGHDPVPVRVELLEIPMGVFIRYFKRLAFAVSWNTADKQVSLVGRALQYDEPHG